MRHHWKMFLLASLILLGSAAPIAALAAQDDASASAVALSSEAASRATAVSAPMITAPASVTAAAGQTETIMATATDTDAGDVLTITATGAPASLTFSHTPSVSPATATLSGTVGLGDVGPWTIDWQVSDGTFTANATTSLTVTENHGPVVDAPASFPGAVSVEMAFAVLVSDPDGDTVFSLTTSALPAGAHFTPNGFITSGEFTWTPALGQEGDYSVTFTAMSGSPALSSSAATLISIGPEDLPPVIVRPATVNGRANHLITFTATCSDLFGEAITLFDLVGTQNTPLPAGATWTPNASNTSGFFSWTPTQAQVGTVNLRYKATDAEPFPLSVGPEQYITKIIVSADREPVVTAPASALGMEGVALTVTVTASDPDGDAIASLTASGLPFGASFSSNATHTAGTLDWTPSFLQAGTHNVTFTASNLLSGSATTALVIANVNRAPTANPGGPYTGVTGLSVWFDGTASSDPDGDALTYLWDFGDGGSNTSDKPTHPYASPGIYTVSLIVTDTGAPPLSSPAATTTASVTDSLVARVFATNQYRSIKLQTGKSMWCARVEPIGGNFNVTDVVYSSLVLQYGGQEVHATSGKTIVASDSDHNGIVELEACFAKSDLRALFAGLPDGHQNVAVTIVGSLVSGASIHGGTTVDVVVSGGSLLASVSPNPFNPEASMSFVTKKAGALKVRLYDVYGRLVRTLADEPNANPGNHELRIDGRADNGSRLASGTYFFRIEAADGQATGRISVLK